MDKDGSANHGKKINARHGDTGQFQGHDFLDVGKKDIPRTGGKTKAEKQKGHQRQAGAARKQGDAQRLSLIHI